MKKMLVEIENILLDNQNPRLKTIHEQEIECLKEILKKSEEKLLNLIIDIAEKGLNPFENIGVLKVKNKFLVLEGNRRICALKILNNNDLVKNLNPKFYKKISNLKTNINKIEVVVFDNREKANEWIQLLHTGENSGKGRVSWNAQNKRLFNSRNLKPLTESQKFLNSFYKKTKLSENVLNKLGDMKVTNLERTLSDKNVKEVLGINKDETGKYNFENIDIEVADKLMYDMVIRKPKVSEVYNKKDREVYIEKVLGIQIPKYMISNKENTNREDLYKIINIEKENTIFQENKKNDDNLDKITNVNEEKKNVVFQENKKIDTDLEKENILNKKQKSNAHTLNRKSLIPKNIILKIEDPKLNNLYRELKNCSFDEYPTLIECSFRIFLELTVNEYNSRHGINSGNATLEQKLKRVIEDLFAKELIQDSERKNLFFLLNENSTSSIKIQNSLIHTKLSLNSETSKKTWDQYQNIIILMYQQINIKIANKRIVEQKKILK